MNNLKQKRFIEEMRPILEEYNQLWFPAGLTNKKGQNYACSECDQECSTYENHDPECALQNAKDTIEEWEKIDQDTFFDYCPVSKNKRSKEEIDMFKNSKKYRAIFTFFIKRADWFVPLDCSDPNNEGIMCGCHIFNENMLEKTHNENCKIVRVSKALANLYS